MKPVHHGRELGQPRVRRHRLSIADGVPPTPSPPVSVTAPGLTVVDANTLLYSPGYWAGHPRPTLTAVLNIESGPSNIAVVPGNVSIQESWRGLNASILETATNASGSDQENSSVVKVPTPITGTAPIIAQMYAGEILTDNVTWGSYQGAGTVSTIKQQRRNGGSWSAFVGSIVVVAGEVWDVRELVSDSYYVDTPFVSNARTVDAIPAITGTAPVLATLQEGETLADNVTWGSYQGVGAISTTKQQSLNSGSWVAYVGTTTLTAGQMWQVRELVSDNLVFSQPFLSNSGIVETPTVTDMTNTITDNLAAWGGTPVATNMITDNLARWT
jgi:hypothetical protein